MVDPYLSVVNILSAIRDSTLPGQEGFLIFKDKEARHATDVPP